MINALFLLKIKYFHLNVVKKQIHRGTDTELKKILCWFCVSNQKASHPLLVFVAYNIVSNYFSSPSLSVTHREKADVELCQGNMVIKLTSFLDFKFVTGWKKMMPLPEIKFWPLLESTNMEVSWLRPKIPRHQNSALSAKSVRYLLGMSLLPYCSFSGETSHMQREKLQPDSSDCWMTSTKQDLTNSHIAQLSKLYRLLKMNVLQE